jgi:hypothetical protein
MSAFSVVKTVGSIMAATQHGDRVVMPRIAIQDDLFQSFCLSVQSRKSPHDFHSQKI